MRSIEEILKEEGPCLSTDLAKKLVERYGITSEAARKRVSRGCPGLRKLAYINFPKNSKFLFLEKDFGSPFYWKALESALVENSSCYSSAFLAIKCRGGIIPKSHFHCISGSPIKQKKHVPSSTVMENLIKSNILVERDLYGLGSCLIVGDLCRDKSIDDLQKEATTTTARIITEEKIVIPAIKKWLINIGLTSKNSVKVRGSKFPKVLNFEWDITASSYVDALSISNKESKKPGFISCDIFLEDEIDHKIINTFIKKANVCSAASRNSRILYIFIAKSYESYAFFMARRCSSMLPITVDTALGRNFSMGVELFTKTIQDLLSASINSESFEQILKAFEGVRGTYGNVKGTLFEFLCMEIINKTLRPTYIERSRTIKTDLGKSEIDIYSEIVNKERLYIECKGLRTESFIDDHEIEKWVNERIPNVLKNIKDEKIDKGKIKIKFELWITCNISESANIKIAQANSSKKYEVSIKNRDDIRGMAKETGDVEILRTYDTIFLDKKGRYEIETPSVDLSNIDFSDNDEIPF